MSDVENEIDWKAQTYSVEYWDASAKATYNQSNTSAGQWYMSATEIIAIDAAEWANSPEGAITLYGQGQVQFQWADNPGRSPFVIVHMMDGNQITGLEGR